MHYKNNQNGEELGYILKSKLPSKEQREHRRHNQNLLF